MFGAGSDEQASSTSLFAIQKRLPWLQVNLATAFLAAAVVGAFTGLIEQITVLAAFLPVVAGQGGNAGAQALAVMLRSLALDEIDPRRPRRTLFKEARVGFVNGVVTGVVAGALAALFSGNTALGVVIATAMTLNLVIAGVAGAAIPLVMARVGQDPAQSSNIILTTVTDIVGFASFLGLAVLARPWLLSLEELFLEQSPLGFAAAPAPSPGDVCPAARSLLPPSALRVPLAARLRRPLRLP